jgi:hypothetical protein
MKPQISIKRLVLVALIFGVTGLINAQRESVEGPGGETTTSFTECQFDYPINDSPPISSLNSASQGLTRSSNVNSASSCGFNILSVYLYTSNSLYNQIIKSQDESCFYRADLSSGYDYAKRSFYKAKNMYYIADRLKTLATGWTPGETAKLKKMLSLVYYLRAGSYINFYDSYSFYNDEVTSPNEVTLKTKLSSLLYKTLADNYYSFINWDFNTTTALAEPSNDLLTFLAEFIELNNGGFTNRFSNLNNNQHAYIGKTVAKIVYKLSKLSNYTSSTKSNKAQLLLLKTQTWHYEHYKKLILAESYVDNTNNLCSAFEFFINQNIYQYSQAEYIGNKLKGGIYLLNAISEVGRYLKDKNNKFYTKAKTMLMNLNRIYNASSYLTIYGKSSSVIDYQSDLDIGDWKDNIERSLYYRTREFTIYNNQITIKLLGNVSSAQLVQVETELLKTWGIFKEIFGAENQLTPATGDRTTRLNVWVHKSKADYSEHAGILFGISTKNGGLFLEGDPSVVNNTANLFFYGFDVDGQWATWNAGHEFWHFLDGKFIKAGGYHPDVSIAWIEGTADLVQKGLIYSSLDNRKSHFQTSINGFKSNRKTPSQIIDIPEQSFKNWVYQDIYNNPSVLWAFFFDEDKSKLRSIGETLKGLTAEQLRTSSVSILKAKVNPYAKYFSHWASGSHFAVNGSYYIKCMDDYRYFDVFGGSWSDEAPIITYSWHGGSNQKFDLEPINNYKTHTYNLRQYGVYFENEFYIKSQRSKKYLKINAADNTKYLKQGPITDNKEKTFSIFPKSNGYYMLTINPDGNNRYAISKSVSNYKSGYSLMDAISRDYTSWKQTFYVNGLTATVGERSSSSSNRGAYSLENLSNKSPEGEFDSEFSYRFFPNPTSSTIVNFTYPKGIGDLKIEAYTITGQKTNLSKVITDNSGKGTLELNLATGIYTMRFIALEDDNKTVTKKLVVL